MLLNWGDLFNRASWCISPRCLTDHPETQGNNKKHLSFPQACERAGQFCFKPQACKSAREALLHVSYPSRASGLLGQALLLMRAEVQEGPAETCESSRGAGSEPAPHFFHLPLVKASHVFKSNVRDVGKQPLVRGASQSITKGHGQQVGGKGIRLPQGVYLFGGCRVGTLQYLVLVGVLDILHPPFPDPCSSIVLPALCPGRPTFLLALSWVQSKGSPGKRGWGVPGHTLVWLWPSAEGWSFCQVASPDKPQGSSSLRG